MQEQFMNPADADKLINYTGPVPGQSLTNSPNQKYPWESPPQLTNRREAELYILEELTDKEKFIALTDAISDGVPIDVMTRTYLLSGYLVRDGIKKISLKSLKLPTGETKELQEKIEEIPEETIQEVQGLLDRPEQTERTSLLGK